MGDDTALYETPYMRYVCAADARGASKHYLIPSFSFCIHTSIDGRRSSQRGRAASAPPSINGWKIVSSYTSAHTAAGEVCRGLRFNSLGS